MNAIRRPALLAALGVLLLPLLSHAAEPAPELAQRLDVHFAARREALGGLAARYVGGLETRFNQAADAGDLALATAYDQEKARVQTLRGTLDQKPEDAAAALRAWPNLPALADGTPDGLVDFRLVWEAERGKIRAELDGKLSQSLQALEVALTKARRLEEARAVLAFRESLPEGSAGTPARNEPGTAATPPSATGPAWPALLEEAKTSIRRIEDKNIQNRVWRDYARSLANCGDFGEAILSAKRIGDDGIKGLALVDVALTLAKEGRFEDAVSAIKPVSDRFRADFGLAQIAAIQIGRNDLPGAARTAELIRGQAGKSIHAVDLAVDLLSKGDRDGFAAKIEEARTLANTLGDETEMQEAFRKIAVAQVNAGDLAGAKATSALYRGHPFGSPTLYIIEALAKNGDFKAAHDIRGSSGFTKFTFSVTGSMIAEAAAAAGKFEEARSVAKGISYTSPRLNTFARIAVIEQDFAAARGAALALFQDDADGDKEQKNGRTLALTGVLQARTEGIDAAVAWARQLKEPNLRSLALIALAEFVASTR